MTAPNASATPQRPRSREARRAAILDAARRAFLRDGYERTSVDTIADLAGVSKQTIYNHGSDKDSLFTQVVADLSTSCAAKALTAIDSVPHDPDHVEDELFNLAIALNERVIDPVGAAFRPLLIAEAHHNPERGRAWAQSAESSMMGALARRLDALVAWGQLAIPDTVAASEQFFALTTFRADRLTLNGVTDIDLSSLEPEIRSAVAMFIASYAP